MKVKINDETTAICNIHREAIALWRKRFNEFGFKGLEDTRRSGAPTKIKESQKNKVIKLACSKPEGGYSNWSQKAYWQRNRHEPKQGTQDFKRA